VPAQTLATDAFVLLKRPPADAFQSFNVFSAEHGTLLVLQRVAKKSATTTVVLDLFDEVSLQLESSNQGRTWFVKEARLIARSAGIGRSYESLRTASTLTALIAATPFTKRAAPPSRRSCARCSRPSPTVPGRMSCISRPFTVSARGEGYPLKQQWFPRSSPLIARPSPPSSTAR